MSLALPSLAVPPPPPLADQLLPLRRHWRLVALCAVLAPSLAGAGLLLTPVRYSATGIVYYDPADANPAGGAPGQPTDPTDQDAVTASQGAIIASLPVAQEIAQQLDLDASPDFNPFLAPRRWPFTLLPRPAAPSPAILAAQVQRRLQVEVQPGSRVLAVGFTAASPDLAAAGANLAMRLYLNHERESAFQSLTDAQSWLQDHAALVQQQLDDTETSLARARATVGLVQGAQATLTTETASRLAASLVEAQADLAMNQARLQAAKAAGGDAAAANAAIAPNLLPLRKEQADLTAQQDALAAQYGRDYPPLVAVRAQRAAISAEIAAETGREMDAARTEVAADEAQIATLQTALAQATLASQTQDEEGAPLRALEQRAEAERDMLRAMTVQAGQLAQQASLTRPDARILSLAAPPLRPVPRHAGLILPAALALGACLGVLLAGLGDALDSSLRSGEALRAEFGLPCHALVPETAEPAAAALRAPFSLYAEQLRALRAGLRLGQGGTKMLAVTAARPEEGKTTLCIALARFLAAEGLLVLVVDGDIRQPSFDAHFGTAGALGLTDHLAGLAELEACLQPDTLSPLTVLPAGTQARAALSLFLSPAVPALLARLRGAYDVVLLDVPPAFALAEGRVLAAQADAALLCVRWGHTPRRVVRAAIALLGESGVRLAGAALTRVDVRRHGRSGFADAEFYTPRYGGYFQR